ncbi:MAG: flagellar hook protein FlgE [Acidobacteriota bacterium]
MSAFSIPLSGLAGSSDSLNVIANNLSNLNTNGYKTENLDFADVFNQMQGVSGNGDPIQIGSGVKLAGQIADYTNGSVSATGIASNMALQGNGFFVVQNTTNGQESFTRDGTFSVNSQGELCTATGQLVMGFPAINGVVSSSSALAPINVAQSANNPAAQTSTFSIDANLNAGAAVGDTFSTPLTVYDSLGTQQTLTVTFTNTATGAWKYNITLPASATGGTGAPTSLASGNMTFDSSGNLTSPASPITGINIAGLADGAANMSLNWTIKGNGGTSLITQQTGTSATTSTYQNGYGVGTLTGYSVLSDGTVQGQFSNNQTMALGRVAIASFANNQGLTQLGNNDMQATFSSGSAVIGQAGAGGNGTITGGAVEESNVNLSTEFADMIVAQQSYDANAKVLTTMNQVSQATIQMIQ